MARTLWLRLVREARRANPQSPCAKEHRFTCFKRSDHPGISERGQRHDCPAIDGSTELDESGSDSSGPLSPRKLGLPAVASSVPLLFRADLPRVVRHERVRAALLELVDEPSDPQRILGKYH